MKRLQKVHPTRGQIPERALAEVKEVEEDARATAKSNQVRRFRLVHVSNLRNAVLAGSDGLGGRAKLRESRLAGDTDDFWSNVKRPRSFARELGASDGEHSCHPLSRRVALAFSKARFMCRRRHRSLGRAHPRGSASAGDGDFPIQCIRC